MEEKNKPFDGSASRHYPIEGMENPTTPIKHKGDALAKNLRGNTGDGKIILPVAKVNNIK